MLVKLYFNEGETEDKLPSDATKSIAKAAQSKSAEKDENWIAKKVFAPIAVSLIIGIITFVITGDFQMGGAMSIITMPINIILQNH